MADLFTVTAPLAIRYKDGTKHILIKTFKHKDGILYLTPFWNQLSEEKMFQFAPGPLKGDGPWKADDAVITVLGCHGTDAELANQFSEWQFHREQIADDYPNDDEINALKDSWIKTTEQS